ncbi:MAG: polynucleotide kinase-phosphatase [Pseudomonadota bacterium]
MSDIRSQRRLTSTISIPEFCLVLMIGPSGSGKSTFAKKHFLPTEVVSSDHCRALVADDELDQSATGDAFDLLEFLVSKRLAARRLTVVDATSVKPEDRARLVRIAKTYHALPVGLVFFLDEKTCQDRNAARADRNFGPHVVRNQLRALKRGFGSLKKRESIRQLHVFDTVEAVESIQSIERTKLWPDKRDEHGPFDIIGDIHGCAGELEALLQKLGYGLAFEGDPGQRSYKVTPPPGRKVIFLGDLIDRGPRSPDVIRLAKSMVDAGDALCILGNHENKFLRKLNGKNVKLTHGLAETVQQMEQQPPEFAEETRAFLDSLISHYVLDDGALVVAHAGIREDMQNRASGAIRSFAMYGDTTGEIDAFGLPVRANWAADYRGRAKVVYGHTPTPEAEWINGTICIDQGCVFGGKLTALRWPERELVDVPAEHVWSEPVRPLSHAPSPAHADPTAIKLDDVQGKRIISTRIGGTVSISEAHAAGALETMSRFAVDPRWLVYLPPTMSPVETSSQDGWLERPEEAFAHYRKQGVDHVICEEKHMGSRAVIVVAKDQDTAKSRFLSPDRTGVITTRTGRPFFPRDREDLVLDRVRTAINKAGWWERFETDWFVLDAEIMPWSEKARSLLTGQYGPVGSAAQIGLTQTVRALEKAVDRGSDVGALLAKQRQRLASAEAFTKAYAPYVWNTEAIDDLRIAPFHILASEDKVHTDRDHEWHMACADDLTAQGDPMMMQTAWRKVDLNDEAACSEAALWWEKLTSQGSEGMVVKPLSFIVQKGRTLLQPAVKVRGKDYLRIIYCADYDHPENLKRLKDRNLRRKRSLAIREFALGHEALERFVKREPLAKVHECVFGVLAMETEPIDPQR